MRVLEDLEDRKKALEKALEIMTSKPSNYGQNISHIKIDRLVEDRKEWRKTIHSAAQKIQEQWEQTKIDTSNERKQAKK
jgi:hypothetical protein